MLPRKNVFVFLFFLTRKTILFCYYKICFKISNTAKRKQGFVVRVKSWNMSDVAIQISRAKTIKTAMSSQFGSLTAWTTLLIRNLLVNNKKFALFFLELQIRSKKKTFLFFFWASRVEIKPKPTLKERTFFNWRYLWRNADNLDDLFRL